MPINYSNYHPKWSLIRRLVLKRANHCCEKCGVPNYSVGYTSHGHFINAGYRFETYRSARERCQQNLDIQLSGFEKKNWIVIVLTVAHVDHDVGHNKFSNLRAWCQRCHLNHDRADNARRRKYGKRFAEAPQLF